MRANTYSISVTSQMSLENYLHTVNVKLDRCRGANANRLTQYQRYILARLYNAAGYHYGMWYRVLQTQVLDEATLHKINQARHCLKTRSAARDQRRVCAMKRNGACTISFTSIQDLAEWAVLHFSGNWRTDLMLTSTPMPPLSPTQTSTEEPDPEQAEMVEFARRANRILPSVSGTIIDVLGTTCQLHTATTWVHLMVGFLEIYQLDTIDVRRLLTRLVTFMFNLNTLPEWKYKRQQM